MLPHLGQYLLNAFLVGIPTARARQTGVAVACLVSSQEQHAAALQSFDARIIKKRTVPIGRLTSRGEGRVVDRRTKPDVSRRRLICEGVADGESFAPTVLLPDEIIIHGGISRRVSLYHDLDLVRRDVVRELKSVQAVPDVAEYDGIRNIRPLVHLFDLSVAVDNIFVLSETVGRVTRTEVVAQNCSWTDNGAAEHRHQRPPVNVSRHSLSLAA